MLSIEIVSWFREGQRLFNDMVYSHLEAIRQGHAVIAYAELMLVGFLYGILHAVGPGHGKAIVCSYIYANENSLKRGLLVVALSSLLQAVTAIALVLGFYYVLGATRTQAEHAAGLLETASYALIGVLGIWLIAQGILTLVRGLFPGKYTHGCETDPCDCGCGHAHAPQADVLEKKKDIASLATMIVSIGVRPCTGALLLLFFSCMFELTLPGVLATLAMAAGTALTTGSLAFLAVKSKDLALSFVDKSERRLLFTHAGLRLAGGVFIFLMAGLFLTAQMGGETTQGAGSHPLFKALK